MSARQPALQSDDPAMALARLRRLRRSLLALSAVIFAGTIAELVLAEHTEDRVQLLPFVLCVAALGCIALLWRHPGPAARRLALGVMAVTAASSLLGVALHFWGNHEFARETRPWASERELLRPSLQGGVPLLAPGILAAGAVLAALAVLGGDEQAKDR